MPEIWTKPNFIYITKFNDKTNQLEKEFQGVSGNEKVYTMPFTKDNLKQLYDRRQNDLIMLAVKEEVMASKNGIILLLSVVSVTTVVLWRLWPNMK
jgi:hypothetical protein